MLSKSPNKQDEDIMLIEQLNTEVMNLLLSLNEHFTFFNANYYRAEPVLLFLLFRLLNIMENHMTADISTTNPEFYKLNNKMVMSIGKTAGYFDIEFAKHLLQEYKLKFKSIGFKSNLLSNNNPAYVEGDHFDNFLTTRLCDMNLNES
ncbi:unnamed protein product [Ambrosiozyma monospora]|uniref:Unnamed protein product n=1 Tax=Ambrosiozyma monospora TaxID=43982 RepID=A0A9W6YRL9_AMBMO|nr:unnamed protein product [Ambrosiozyma monospora]